MSFNLLVTESVPDSGKDKSHHKAIIIGGVAGTVSCVLLIVIVVSIVNLLVVAYVLPNAVSWEKCAK